MHSLEACLDDFIIVPNTVEMLCHTALSRKKVSRERSLPTYLKNKFSGLGEMTHLLGALSVLQKDAGSIPSIHMAAHNCL